jgi:hypothetical protein
MENDELDYGTFIAEDNYYTSWERSQEYFEEVELDDYDEDDYE